MTAAESRIGVGVRLERLCKRFGSVVALDGVSLAVEAGEFLTLLGPSGSGKTTTMHIVAGFESATSGEVYVDGRPVARVPPHRRDVGLVFQNYALFPHMTAADNIAFPLRMRKTSRETIRRAVERALHDYTTDPKRQAVFTEYAAYSTSHPQAVDYLPEADRKNTSMWPANRARTVSLTEKEMDWIVENLNTINDRWNAWISQ